MITQDRLKELLLYDELTGKFTWRSNNKRRKAGEAAGNKDNRGYWKIGLDGKAYSAHRLAWLYVYGHWPEIHVDHANLDKIDNRIANLRLATISQNTANHAISSRNTSGFKGVTWNRSAGKWQAFIKADNKFHYLGLFVEPRDAHRAYEVSSRKFFGQFARPE